MATKIAYNELTNAEPPHFTNGGTIGAQLFTVPNNYDRLDYAQVKVRKYGDPPGNFNVSIYATSGGVPVGSPLVTKSVSASSLPTTYPSIWVTMDFTDITIIRGNTYAICLSAPSVTEVLNNMVPPDYYSHADGNNHGFFTSTNGGGSWNSISNYELTYRIYGSQRIPYITNAVDFTTGDNIPLTIYNPGLYYLKALTYVNGTLIKTQNLGAVTAETLTFDSGEIADMYAEIPNSTSCSMYVRLQAYTTSGYTTQVGTNQDKAGTMSIDQVANKPTFSTFSVANKDKTIVLQDKYSNTLNSVSTATLLGANTKMIKGYSDLRAVVAEANAMVPLNSATGDKYRFESGLKSQEEDYAASGDVNLDIVNANESTVSVTAYDSRGLTTKVTDNTTITNNAEFIPVDIWDIGLVRDNGVDSQTKLSFSASYWNEYFGGGSSGVQNDFTIEWRYKETTESWGAQSWTDITASVVDTDGSLSFEAYINGDLGASGFDPDKSYNIEVRIYDEISQKILEGTLNKGTPVIDITSEGVAFGARYDAGEGGAIQVLGKNILNIMYPIGSIYTNASDDTNPGTLLGFGTWEAFAAGRVLVGLNSSDADFDTAEETGGAKTHTLTTAEMPTHTHVQNSHYHTQPTHDHGQASHSHGAGALSGYQVYQSGSASRYRLSSGTYRYAISASSIDGVGYASSTASTTANNYWGGGDNTGGTTATNQNAGSGDAHNNMPPYIVVYMWKRTA